MRSCHWIPSYPCIQSELFACPHIILHKKAIFELSIVLVFASTLSKRVGGAQHEICQRTTRVRVVYVTGRGPVKSELSHGRKIILDIAGSTYGLHPEFQLILS